MQPLCGNNRNRTDNFMLAKHTLCQLSYIVKALETIGIEPIAFCLQSKHSSQLSYAPSVVKVLLLEQLKNMVTITLQDMYLFTVDKQMDDYLTKLESRESPVNNPNVKRLNLSGVRMGVVHVFGDNASILKSPETKGGFDAAPTMFQFGYQFERQYLNQGRVQGLFEFIPTVTGLEQGMLLRTWRRYAASQGR